MPRLSFKPDSSFFRKIVVGAVGAQAACCDLAKHGHDFVELERGSTNSKLWKDVKRKRVRIPDLVCLKCGARIECRAKTENTLSMSHSPTDAERAWDYGMVDADWVAFPVCHPVEESDWANGRLMQGRSYWRQKDWVSWQANPYINYFTVKAFRSEDHGRSNKKGVEEGSESFISWDATFSTRNGPVVAIGEKGGAGKITVARSDGSRPYTWTIKPKNQIFVSSGDLVAEGQVIAGTIAPLARSSLVCPGRLSEDHILKLLRSRERTQRFTGIKLARLCKKPQFEKQARESVNDSEEDVYVRLEAVSYLVSCCRDSVRDLFQPYLAGPDPQTQLEAVIALGEAGTSDAVELLGEILRDTHQLPFLRSASAWSLGQVGSKKANASLIAAFSDVDEMLRFEALENLVAVGCPACEVLLDGLTASDEQIVAGCAEALRQTRFLPDDIRQSLVANIRSDRPNNWAVWLIAHLPREQFNTAIAELQTTKPELHYAISLLWSFVGSWIATHWEVNTSVSTPSIKDGKDAPSGTISLRD